MFSIADSCTSWNITGSFRSLSDIDNCRVMETQSTFNLLEWIDNVQISSVLQIKSFFNQMEWIPVSNFHDIGCSMDRYWPYGFLSRLDHRREKVPASSRYCPMASWTAYALRPNYRSCNIVCIAFIFSNFAGPKGQIQPRPIFLIMCFEKWVWLVSFTFSHSR